MSETLDLGPVPGVMGVLQALECVKVITGLGDTLAGRLLMFDATSAVRPFSVVRLRRRDVGCAACGLQPQITAENVATYDYLGFTTNGSAVGRRSLVCNCSLMLCSWAFRLTTVLQSFTHFFGGFVHFLGY